MSPQWKRAAEAAAAVLPAESWRANLAQALWETGEVALVGVFTCAPRHLQGAQVAHVPAQHASLVQTFLRKLLPRIERGGYGTSLAHMMGGEVYAPFEVSPDPALVAQVTRELLEPVGAAGLLNVFLLDDSSEVIGWISLATRRPSKEAQALFGAELGEVARTAEATLRNAMGLAAACGAKTPPPLRAALDCLSPREREVAMLVGSGMSDLNIAQHLSISEETVGSHLRRIFAKLGVHTRVEVALLMSGLGREGGAGP